MIDIIHLGAGQVPGRAGRTAVMTLPATTPGHEPADVIASYAALQCTRAALIEVLVGLGKTYPGRYQAWKHSAVTCGGTAACI